MPAVSYTRQKVKMMGQASAIIRIATPDDADSLAVLNNEFNDSNIPASEIAASLVGANTETTVVAEVEGSLVGFACMQIMRSWCYRGSWATLVELYVQPASRRHGLGRQLVECCEQIAREKGITEMGLLTGSSNTAGQALYTSMGYQVEEKLSLNKSLSESPSTG